MSFFGIFGGKNDDDKNCDCNKVLKDHLKKCAGYGQRPPVVEGCSGSSGKADECDDLSGPPKCKGKTEAPKCCPVTKYNKPKLFVPKCNVPPTATFKCPASTCNTECDDTSAKSANNAPKKPDCTPGAGKGQAKSSETTDSKSKSGGGACGGSGNGNSGSGKGGSGSGSGSGSENDCEPRPLQM